MYTVIIAEKKHFEAIQQNSLYFKPFIDRLNEDVAFCEWNPEGETLYECVPDLIRAVGRHKTWRAVILNVDSRTLYQNPFDVIEHKRIVECEENNKILNPVDEEADGTEAVSSASGETEEITSDMFDEWKKECNEKIANMLSEKGAIYREAVNLPLQRLATCLCYVPDALSGKKITKKIDIGDYVQGQLDYTNFEKHLVELEHVYHLEEERLKTEIRTECLEAMLPGDNELRRKGSMGIIVPTEVICFAERTTETGFFDARIYWENRMGFEYSSFVGRNMYFDKMRFIVQDILPETHQNYRYDRIRTLYNFLVFATNDVPSGTLLPRKLYYLDSENNENALSVIASAYIEKLENTIEILDGQIEKIKREAPEELSDSDAMKLFCAKVSVPVPFSEDFSEDDLYADHKDYGYFSDSFGDDHVTWQRQRIKTNETVEKLVKQPRRALKKAVDKKERECNVDYNMIRALNTFQMGDVSEHTELEKDKMVSMDVTNIFDLSRYQKELDEEGKKVQTEIDRRMKKKTNFILGAICAAIFFITFLPLVFSNRTNVNTVSTAVLFSAAAVALLLVIFVVAVILMRRPLRKAMAGYNNKTKEIRGEVDSAMKKYSDYLSCVCNIIRGYKVLNFSSNHIDKFDRDIRIRTKHKNDMEKLRALLLDNYGDFINDDIKIDDTLVTPYDFDFGREKTEYSYDPPYLPDENYTIEYLEAGNRISLASDFVHKVTIRMEEIYD